MNKNGLDQDPIVIHLNDLVVWQFEDDQKCDVHLIKSQKDLFQYVELARDILPRKFLSRAFKEPGVFHFVSPSFDTTVDESNIENARGLDVF